MRTLFRLAWLGGELLLAALTYLTRCGFCPRHLLPAARAKWLQHSSRRFLRIFDAQVKSSGEVPRAGLLVCNHLGYFDIVVLASLAPCAFVAKSEVKHWPVFGWFARLAGTIFVKRERRTEVGQTTSEMEAALRAGRLLVLFPEGTSSGGETVLPFKSALLEPATRPAQTLTAGFIRYELDDGDVSEEVCYWKDMTLLPHLLNLLGRRAVRASVRFAAVQAGGTDRKELAQRLHAKVMGLKAAAV